MRPPHFSGGDADADMIGTYEGDASMRPPHFSGGDLKLPKVLGVPAGPASMRPPHFSGGDDQPLPHRDLGLVASMRPPHFSGGDNVPTGRRLDRDLGFNEATAF